MTTRPDPRRRPWLGVVALLAALVLLAAACGTETADDVAEDDPPPPGEDAEGDPDADAAPDEEMAGHEAVFAAIEGLSPEEREQRLLELVEQEGRQLVWFSAAHPSWTEDAAAAFQDKYDIEVIVYRAGTGEMTARLLQEAEAGLAGSADIFDTDGMTVQMVIQEGHTVPYSSPHLDALLPEAVGDGWQANRFNLMTVSWNTERVSEDERPQSYEDLADPRWNDRLIVGSDDIDWFKTLWEYWVDEEGKSEEEVEELFRSMVEGSLVVRSRSQRANMLAAGEADASASHFTFITDGVADDGAPVTWRDPAPVEPIIIVPQGGALMGNGRNPAAAVLFQDWLLSEAQETITATSARADLAERDLAAGVHFILVDTEDLLRNQEEWAERWDEMTRALGQEVPGD